MRSEISSYQGFYTASNSLTKIEKLSKWKININLMQKYQKTRALTSDQLHIILIVNNGCSSNMRLRKNLKKNCKAKRNFSTLLSAGVRFQKSEGLDFPPWFCLQPEDEARWIQKSEGKIHSLLRFIYIPTIFLHDLTVYCTSEIFPQL